MVHKKEWSYSKINDEVFKVLLKKNEGKKLTTRDKNILKAWILVKSTQKMCK